ncbi:MAG: hypothetical protein ACE5FU_03520 [Nitrospinota bacterium]
MKYLKAKEGIALITVLMFMTTMAIFGFMLLDMSMSNIKTGNVLEDEMSRFYGADGGVHAVAGWMTLYKRTDTPAEVLVTNDYTATSTIMGATVRDAEGYSVQWKGMNVLIQSQSPPVNPTSTIESIIFVPIAPVGYGNE